MVLISGLTLALVVLIIAGAAAATPKDSDSERKAEATSLAQEVRPEDLAGASQGRRTKRAHGNLIPPTEDDDEAFWAAKGHRIRLGDAEEVPEGQQGPTDPILLRPFGWSLPQRAEEEEVPFGWEPRGRRCCSQVKGVMDLKRGYGKDRVKALVAKIIAGSGGTESEDAANGEEDVFWAARGKRRQGEESAAGAVLREPRSRL